MLVGEMIIDGLTKGIKSIGHHPVKEIEKVAKATVTGLSKAVAAISDGIDADMNLEPQIRPIVDMSDVVQGGLLVDELFGNKALHLAATAAGTSASVPTSIVDQNGQPISGTSIEMIQNNYSPKALSRIEIYRQTRNQLRGAKGLLTE